MKDEAVPKTVRIIRNRRSLRVFTNEHISQEVVVRILECGLAAPSSKNSNPWFFVYLQGKEKESLVQWLIEEVHTLHPDATAPSDPRTGKKVEGIVDTIFETIDAIQQSDLLVLLFNRAPFSHGEKEVIRCIRESSTAAAQGKVLYDYANEIVGIASAAQNMQIAAKAYGIGSVYMADSYPLRERIKRELRTTKELVGAIAFGYPAHDRPPRDLQTQFAKEWKDAVGIIDASVQEQEPFWFNGVFDLRTIPVAHDG